MLSGLCLPPTPFQNWQQERKTFLKPLLSVVIIINSHMPCFSLGECEHHCSVLIWIEFLFNSFLKVDLRNGTSSKVTFASIYLSESLDMLKVKIREGSSCFFPSISFDGPLLMNNEQRSLLYFMFYVYPRISVKNKSKEDQKNPKSLMPPSTHPLADSNTSWLSK